MAKKTTINKAYVEKFVAENGYPERGTLDQDQLKKFYKHLSDEQVAEWMELEGLTHNPSDSAPINRMRMCMSILYAWFPKEPSAKKKSKYADYTLEKLLDMVVEKEVAVEVTEDERIMRMRAIMALRAAGHID